MRIEDGLDVEDARAGAVVPVDVDARSCREHLFMEDILFPGVRGLARAV